MIKVILFDLDGTLLPMNQDEFVKAYFGLLAKKLAPIGYEPKQLINSIWAGTKAMVLNNGEKTNEEVFWDKFAEIYGEKVRKDITYFYEYYKFDFDKVQSVCGYNPKAKYVIDKLKKLGYRLALATNPIFPAIATEKRIKWAGLDKNDFELYTTYENSKYSKPNPNYYASILETLGVKPKECLMVGNDATEDMIANSIGINVYLFTDCLINKEGKDISAFPQGDFDQLLNYITKI